MTTRTVWKAPPSRVAKRYARVEQGKVVALANSLTGAAIRSGHFYRVDDDHALPRIGARVTFEHGNVEGMATWTQAGRKLGSSLTLVEREGDL